MVGLVDSICDLADRIYDRCRATAHGKVTGVPNNCHKSFKARDIGSAWKAWVDQCLAGAITGPVSSNSLVGYVLPSRFA